MNSPQSGPASVSSGVLGARPPRAQTFHGSDPDLVASTAICQVTPTKCQARTRIYRHGTLELEGFPVAEISDHLVDAAVTVWLDLRDPDHSDLAVLSDDYFTCDEERIPKIRSVLTVVGGRVTHRAE